MARARGAALCSPPRAAPPRRRPPLRAAARGSGSNSSSSSRGSSAHSPAYALVVALGATGAAETAYLTYEKLTGGTVACPIGGGCTSVLQSPYADVPLPGGATLPLAALGCGAYALAAALGAKGVASQRVGAQEAQWEVALGLGVGWERWPLALQATLMATTSGCLMYVLAFRLHTECAYCIASAALSTGLVVTTLAGLSDGDRKAFAPYGAATALATLLAFGATFGGVQEADAAGKGGAAAAPPTELTYAPPEITTESSPRAMALARRLRAAGAKFYGAFWCSHCKDQKLALGRQAMAVVEYVECFPDGWRKGEPLAPACAAADVKGFPWWEIAGEAHSGEQTFDQLEAILDAVESIA